MHTFESEGYEIAFDDEGEGHVIRLMDALEIDKADLFGYSMGGRNAGSPIPLAESIPGAKAVIVPGRSHLSCITDGFFKGAVTGLLGFR